jgi:hypothetical protein
MLRSDCPLFRGTRSLARCSLRRTTARVRDIPLRLRIAALEFTSGEAIELTERVEPSVAVVD